MAGLQSVRVLSEHPVLPNYFFAFAPNTQSFHGANITREKWIGIDDTMQRRTVLGFITSKKDRGGQGGGKELQS